MTFTPYHLKIAPAAQRKIRALPNKQQKLVMMLIEALAVNPRPPGAKRIEGMTGLYAQDLEQLTLIYKVDEQEILLLVVK